jgi:DNA-binding transcriptional LysR family regulator
MKNSPSSSPVALQDMALFVEVARALNFTRASEASGVSVATLSRRITSLEKRVGVRLLERSTRRVALTEPGRRYLERCERIVQEAGVAHEALREEGERPSGHLRVSMPVEFGLVYVAPLVDEFAQAFPDISMELEFSPRPAPLAEGSVDVGIRLGEVRDHSLVARRLGSAARVLYASPGYLAKHGLPRLPKDLAKHECILASYMAQPKSWQLWRGKEAVEVEVHGRFSTNNVSMTLRLAEKGHGVAVLSPAAARAAHEAGTIRRVLDDWNMSPIAVHVVTTSRILPARTRAFVDFLAARLAPEG